MSVSMAGLVVEPGDVDDERPDDPLRRVHLEVLAVERDVLAVRRVADEAPAAAGPDIHLHDGRRVAAGTPPVRDPVGVRDHRPDEVARGVEDALEHELQAVLIDHRALVAELSCCRHRSAPFVRRGPLGPRFVAGVAACSSWR